jgi:hypothetical protein
MSEEEGFVAPSEANLNAIHAVRNDYGNALKVLLLE